VIKLVHHNSFIGFHFSSRKPIIKTIQMGMMLNLLEEKWMVAQVKNFLNNKFYLKKYNDFIIPVSKLILHRWIAIYKRFAYWPHFNSTVENKFFNRKKRNNIIYFILNSWNSPISVLYISNEPFVNCKKVRSFFNMVLKDFKKIIILKLPKSDVSMIEILHCLIAFNRITQVYPHVLS